MPDFSTSVTVPAQAQNVTVPEQTVVVPERTVPAMTNAVVVDATVTVDTNNLRTVLRLTGWPEDKIDIGQAIAMAESAGYSDAVGDLTLVTPLWGPSIGLFQIRALRAPQAQYQSTDIWRHAWPLRQPFYNASAALALSKGATDFSPWSVFTSKSYEQYLGGDPAIKTGHAQAANWWK